MSDTQKAPDGAGAPEPAVTATVLRAWLTQARRVAQDTRELVDSLNVFPVPDADTGTNVLLTLRAAGEALTLLPASADLAQTARAAADGAVRGARGNSGLLVSQALTALADVCAESSDPSRLRPVELLHAYERIATTTWQAVSRPVTGTLLTVARDAAAGARTVLEESGANDPATVSKVAAAAAFGAQESVVETTGLGHGPVDAGGAALMLMFTGLSDAINGAGLGQDHPYTDVAWQMLTDLVAGAAHGHGTDPTAAPFSTGEFEVMYLLEATAAQAADLRTTLERIGDSVGVVGTPDALGVGLFQVHVHTDTPRGALPRAGRARQICIHHLHPTALAVTAPWEAVPLPVTPLGGAGHVVSFERLAARRAQREAAQRDESVRLHPSQYGGGRAAAAEPGRAAGQGRVGVIACTRAPGLIEQVARTGAVVVLDPDRDGIVRAAGDLGLAQIAVLPCDPDCAASAHEAARFLAARSAVSTVRGPGAVETTRTTPEAVQLIVCDTDDEARVLAAAVAVAGAGETADLSELARRAGQAAIAVRTIALSGAQAEPDAVATALTSALRPDDELVTAILGREALPDVGALVDAAVARYCEEIYTVPDRIEVVIHAGAQAGPDVLLAIE